MNFIIKTILTLYSVRFGEALRICTDKLDSKNFYAFNPSFDRKKCKKASD